jgi:hypothetical protein
MLALALCVALVLGVPAAQPGTTNPQPGISVPPVPAPPEEDRTPEAVRKSFDAYKEAILNDKGSEAAKWVDKQTLDWYEESRQLALKAGREKLESLSMFNRMQAILIRHRVPLAELEKMDGRGLFAYAVDNGWVGKSSVSGLAIGEVSITGAFAAGTLVREGKATALKFQFSIEEGVWKVKLLPLMKMAEPGLKAQAKRAGMTENEFIIQMTEAVSGRKVPATIWDAPK